MDESGDSGAPKSGGEAEAALRIEPIPDEPLGARRADALQRLAERCRSLRAAGQPSRPDPHLVVVNVDLQRL